MEPAVDVIVVGAGVAGLSCAAHLAREGRSVAVLEASDGVGGRVRTDVVDGFRLDRGFQVLLEGYPEPAEVLDLDALELCRFARGAIIRHDGRWRRVTDPRESPLGALRSLAGPVVSARDAVALTRLLRSRSEQTTDEALRASGLTAPAESRFLRPFLRGITLDPELRTTSRFGRSVLSAFARGPAAVPAYGMGAIAEQLAGGLDVRLGARVASVGAGTVALDGGGQLTARAVVVAAAGVLDQAPHGWSSVTTLYFDAPAPPFPGPWLVLDGEGSGPVNELVAMSEVSPDLAPPGRALVSASVPGTTEVDLDEVQAQLRGWFGRDVEGWRHLRTYPIAEALPAWPAGTELEREPRLLPGLYACGDHREHPSLDGALASGRKAAAAVLADLSAEGPPLP